MMMMRAWQGGSRFGGYGVLGLLFLGSEVGFRV